MHIYIGSDHGGFEQKNMLIQALEKMEYTITDCGSYTSESTDYPDFALAVGRSVKEHPHGRGILLCRSGEGMEMAVNKVPKIRAALAWNEKVAAETRHDNNANVLVIPSDFVSSEEALTIARTFLETKFSGEERHVRRIEKIENIERLSYES